MSIDGAYGRRPIKDAVRVARAMVSNQVARFLPRAYNRLTGETGRGREASTPKETACYFMDCVHEYMDVLGEPRSEADKFWANLRVVEYGPGDIPGVALLLAGLGARSVLCVDRFSLVRFDSYQQEVINELAKLLPDESARERMWSCFKRRDDLVAGLGSGPVKYCVTASGIVGQKEIADLVISRAVLEHVNDLTATIRDMAEVLAKAGLAIHKVDLKSHGLHRCNRLDFLTWPDRLWRLMYSHKGAPNRLRLDSYVREVERAGLQMKMLRPCEVVTPSELDEIRPFLVPGFGQLQDKDLSCLSFWMIVEHARSH